MKLRICQRAFTGPLQTILSPECPSILRLQQKVLQKYTSLDQCPPKSPTPHRSFHTSPRKQVSIAPPTTHAHGYVSPASDIDRNITEEEKAAYDKRIAEDKGKAIRTPWQREGADQPPVSRNRSAGAMTKGRHNFKPRASVGKFANTYF